MFGCTGNKQPWCYPRCEVKEIVVPGPLWTVPFVGLWLNDDGRWRFAVIVVGKVKPELISAWCKPVVINREGIVNGPIVSCPFTNPEKGKGSYQIHGKILQAISHWTLQMWSKESTGRNKTGSVMNSLESQRRSHFLAPCKTLLIRGTGWIW